MSRPVVRRTYGNVNRTSSNSDINPFNFPSSPYSFDLQTPPSSPPSKRARHSPSSSPSHVSPVDGAASSPLTKKVKAAPTQSTLSGFFTSKPKRREPLVPIIYNDIHPVSAAEAGPSRPTKPAQSKTTSSSSSARQMYLTHLPLLHTCKDCQMSYVRGGDDEEVHAKHHSRVMRGIVWDGLGRRKAGNGDKTIRRTPSGGIIKEAEKGWREVGEVRLSCKGSGKEGARARMIECDASWGGSKLDEILSLVDISLSSPPLPPAILERCKVYLAVTSATPPPAPGRQRPGVMPKSKSKQSEKERIVGVVVSQGIKWAMRVLESGDDEAEDQAEGVAEGVDKEEHAAGTVRDADAIDPAIKCNIVDSGGGVKCDPTPLPTSLGIHRLYTIPTFRSLGLARALLDAACAHTIYACPAKASKGQVAFSQPTESGWKVMRAWGGGRVRVFVDDESQL